MGSRFQTIEGGKARLGVGKGHYRNSGRQSKYSRRPSGKLSKSFTWSLLILPAGLFFAISNWTSASPVIGAEQQAFASFASSDTETASFGFCHERGGMNCVVDGDTLYYQGTKIRIADIDTPETHPPNCPEEARLGRAATQKLHALVNDGPFSLSRIDRDEDVYGRKLRLVTRNGQSLGGALVTSGLARWYGSGRQSWC